MEVNYEQIDFLNQNIVGEDLKKAFLRLSGQKAIKVHVLGLPLPYYDQRTIYPKTGLYHDMARELLRHAFLCVLGPGPETH